MAKRRNRKSKRGSAHTTSILTTLFAVTPALYILTNNPPGYGTQQGALGALLGGGGSWQSLALAATVAAQTVIQNWVTILILLGIVFVGITVIRKVGRGARISKHLRA